ncbi:lipoprotein [Klebsiella pneumoniae]|uniref:Lipoprotein n=1 Tax=Klebsiella pneumoniae TaxID=573 RepID=A0A927DLR7_KLEPN|nr:lipoprotein [Klebsiella pneumoniae]
MKKLFFAGMVVALAGCVQVDRYEDVVKAPAPAGLAGFWQTKGPQSAMMSPDAIASLIVTKEGDTFDCRQWQRVIAQPGKLMNRDSEIYNVTASPDIYPVEREGNTISYDRMTLSRVERLTPECEGVGQSASDGARQRAGLHALILAGHSWPARRQRTTIPPLTPTRSRSPRYM